MTSHRKSPPRSTIQRKPATQTQETGIISIAGPESSESGVSGSVSTIVVVSGTGAGKDKVEVVKIEDESVEALSGVGIRGTDVFKVIDDEDGVTVD